MTTIEGNDVKISQPKKTYGYYNSWWIPTLIAVLMLLATSVITAIKTYHALYSEVGPGIHWSPMGPRWSYIAEILLFLSWMGILTAALWNLVCRRWKKVFANLLMFALIGVAILFAYSFAGSTFRDLKCKSFQTTYQSIPPDERTEPIERSAPLSLEPESFGSPEMFLVEGAFSGLGYDLYAYINPGEPGSVGVYVIEPRKDWYLHEYGKSSDASVDWSDNPEQQFLYHRELIVDEDCGEYPVRVEIWFYPASRKKPSRKLLERTFIIEDYIGR